MCPFLSARVLCFAIAVPLLLKLKLTTLDALLDQRMTATGPPPQEDVIDRIVTCVTLVLSVGRRAFGWACLHRGLTLYYFLRRKGVDVQLCFGIGRSEANFTAHCWLVRDGLPFLEKSDPRQLFAEMYIMPGNRRREPRPQVSPGQ
jgi:hypothetical protein